MCEERVNRRGQGTQSGGGRGEREVRKVQFRQQSQATVGAVLPEELRQVPCEGVDSELSQAGLINEGCPGKIQQVTAYLPLITIITSPLCPLSLAPPAASTWSSIRLLSCHAHRESEEFFRLTGQLVQPNQDCVFSKCSAFSNCLKSKVGHIMAKATALLVHLNLVPFACNKYSMRESCFATCQSGALPVLGLCCLAPDPMTWSCMSWRQNCFAHLAVFDHAKKCRKRQSILARHGTSWILTHHFWRHLWKP